MAKMNNREDALLQAYLSRYKAAQDSAVTGGQQSTQKAQRQGSAILNATDKTLPSLGNHYASTLQNIVGGASTENSLNLDFMNRQVSLAKKKFDMANDYAQQVKKAQEYAEKQAKAAAKAAARAASGGSSSSGDTESAASLDALFGSGSGTNNTANSTKPNSTKPNSNSTTNSQKKPSAQEQYLADKASGKRKAVTGNSYAERVSAAQPAQSRAVTKGGKVIGSSYAAAGSAPSASESKAAKERQKRVADSLQKLQTDASYRAELAAPGRKLTSAEVQAVKEYNQKPGDLVKQMQAGELSFDDYYKQAQELARMNQKASLNGLGQDMQAFASGLMTSVPFLRQVDNAVKDYGNKATNGQYGKSLESGADDVLQNLQNYQEQNRIAAAAGTMAGKSAQYGMFNNLMEGTPLAKAMGKTGNAVVGQAQKIPVLGGILGAGAGDALGRILTDTTADLALDTLPSLASDVSEGKSAGEIAGNTAKNIVGNVAMNALPEIGGAVFNKIKGAAGDAAQVAAQDAAQAAKTQETPAFYLYTVPADDTQDYTKVIQDVSADAQKAAAQRTRAQELQELLAQQAAQDKAEYAAKQAGANSANLPIDGATGTAYNKANGGVLDENLGGVLSGDVSLGINHLPGAESESGDVFDFVSGRYGAAGAGNAAQNLAAGTGANGTGTVQSLEEWAKGLTGKDRRSNVTRGVEDIQRRLQAGESYDTLKRDADSLALSIVGDGVFGESVDADETTLLLKEYFGKTEIHVGEAEKNEILRKTGLKNLQQFNYQNGTRLTTKPAHENFDTALQQLADMGVRVDGAMESGNQLDPFLEAIEKTKPQPLAMSAEETALNSAYTEYISEHILRGVSAGEASNQGFEAWLLRQNLTDESPDYMRTAKDWALDGVALDKQYDLNSLEDNYILQNNAPYYDGKDLNDILPQNGVLDSDVSDSFAREHLNAAKAVNGAEVPKESPYYDDWLRTQGALRQEQTRADLSGEAADMQKAANRLDALNAQNEALLQQNDIWQAEQNKRMARQQALDEIQARYEDAVNRVPALDNLTDTSGWQTQQGAYFDGGVPYLTKDNTMPDTAKGAAQSLPLNGSESVPEHAVGAASTQYDRREVLNQDYANQRRFNADLEPDEVAALGADQNTHTLYTRKESADTARLNYDTYLQQGDGSISEANKAVLQDLRGKNDWNADDIALAKHAAEQQYNYLLTLEKGSDEYNLEFARYKMLDKETSRGLSGVGRALQEGREAKPNGYTGIRKFEQYTQVLTDDFAKTRDGKGLQQVADVVYNGEINDFLTQLEKENRLDEAMLEAEKQIRNAAKAKNVKISDDAVKSAAASLVAGGNADDMFNALARTKLGIGDISQEDYDFVRGVFEQVADMPDSKARRELEMSAYSRLAQYMPAKSFGDKVNNIRYLCMLGNTRTHGRNILGNILMNTVVRTKDNVAGVMQLALPQDQRTKAIGTMLTADGRKMADLARDYADNKMYSVLYDNGKYNVQTGLEGARRIYKEGTIGNALESLARVNSNALEKEDAYFLKAEFGNSMASFLKARGYDSSVFTATDDASKQVLLQAAAQALNDAKVATFHEDNFLSTALSNLSKDMRYNGGSWGKLGYAIEEGILPFKKTPLNIAKNAIDYAGGSYLKAGAKALGRESATDVIDELAKGVTGSAIMGIGYILARNGFLTGGTTGDDRADSYRDMNGEQDYAVKIPGKGTYTLDWASPAAVPLLVGAEIAQDNSELTPGVLLDKFRHLSQPVLETTMLQGLNDTLDNISYADSDEKLFALLAGGAGDFARQFVPTVLGQAARTVDPVRRSSYGGGQSKTERDTGYALRSTMNRIPGLSRQNEAYIDQWGREQASLDGTGDDAEGMLWRGAYNMLSPGYYRSENITPVDEYLQGLYGGTNDSHVLPEKASSKITVDNENYYMTPQEKTEYAKTSGQTAYDIVDSLRQNSMFLQLPEDQQSEIVQDAYSVAKTVGGVSAVGDGVSGTNSKAYQAYEQGGTEGFSQYVLMKNATDLVRDEKRESSGNESATLNTVETWNTLYSQFGDDAVGNFVNSTDKGSTVRNISDLAGDKAVTAYMQSYSAVANTLGDGQTPDKYTVGYGMQKYGLNGDDFARAYLAAYYKKDKNGKYPEKGSSYADKAGAEIYQSYGADALQGWVNYRATIPDTNGNGKVDKDEAMARLNEMDLTNELRRAYLAKTNKQWKNPY